MHHKKVSIVTVCYNVAKELAATVASVRKQTFEDYEYIVVDGGSKDETVEVINSNSDVISKWVSEPDRGIYDAMNKGIDMADGEWIIFMNAGDAFYDENVLSQIFNKDYDDNVGVIYGDVEVVFGNAGSFIRSLHNIKPENVACELCHQGSLTRTSILKRIKYDLSFRIMADLNSFVVIKNMGYAFAYCPVVFAIFVAGGISSTKPFQSLRESCRIRGIKKYSVGYLRGLFRAIVRYVLLKVLSDEAYNRFRYKKVSSLKLYQR